MDWCPSETLSQNKLLSLTLFLSGILVTKIQHWFRLLLLNPVVPRLPELVYKRLWKNLELQAGAALKHCKQSLAGHSSKSSEVRMLREKRSEKTGPTSIKWAQAFHRELNKKFTSACPFSGVLNESEFKSLRVIYFVEEIPRQHGFQVVAWLLLAALTRFIVTIQSQNQSKYIYTIPGL